MLPERDVRRALVVIFATIALDAVGLGLVFPILPQLLADVADPERVSAYVGVTAAVYAVMQFLFAPALGALSDRVGRRPVLLLSLAGAVVGYAVMAAGHSLWVLLLGRAIAGLTSANLSVATAYITDVSPDESRARRFGLFNAMSGLGFIVGPVLGGVLGAYGLRLPFVVAAALNAVTFALALRLLPESRVDRGAAVAPMSLNPFRQLRWAMKMGRLLPLMAIYFLFTAVGEAYGTCWALWGTATFGWNGPRIGLSLGAFGVCQALAQAFVPGPAVKRLGETWTVLFSVACTCVALVVIAFAVRGWIVFALMPLFALGGIGAPALQTLATRSVGEDEQGRFQGVLASVVSLASILSPLVFSSIYVLEERRWPGAVWLSVAVLNAVVVPIIARLDFGGPGALQVRSATLRRASGVAPDSGPSTR